MYGIRWLAGCMNRPFKIQIPSICQITEQDFSVTLSHRVPCSGRNELQHGFLTLREAMAERQLEYMDNGCIGR